MGSLNKMLFTIIVLMDVLLCSATGRAQKIDTISTFSMTGYIDAYYSYYTDSVGPGNYQKFPTVSPRNNTPGLNIAQVSFVYNADKIRATGVFGYGDILNSTWSHPYNNIMEAHVGFKVYSKLWIDAGFFRTHFGTEFLLPSENITSSVAVGTYYEPYYESGIRLNFDPTTKLEINLFFLNGYNVFVDNNQQKSFGMGITYVVNDNMGIGYTNYIGDDSPDSVLNSHMRFANNVFVNYQRRKLKVQVGADYFIQQNSDIATHTKTASMYSAVATVRYQCKPKFAVYARGEFFNDADAMLSTVYTDKAGTASGYKLWGVTAGMEYKPTPESYVKLEGRRLQMADGQNIFYYNGLSYSTRFEIMLHAGVTFDLLKNIKTKNNDL